MNATQGRKYKGSRTIKKITVAHRHGRSNVIHNSRTYHRIRGGYHQINIIGGGGTKEDKDAKKAANKAAKEEKEKEEAAKKESEKEAARVLKEEQADAEKQRQKDAKEAAKIKAKQPPAKNKKNEPVKDVANEDTNEAAKPPGNANTVETTNANISNAEQLVEGAIQIVPGNTDANTTNINTNETSTDELAKPEPAKPEPSKPEPAKPEPAKPEPAKPEPEKIDGWVKKTLKNTGAAIKNIAWGDANTGKLKKTAKLLISPITLPGTAIGNTFKGLYKGAKWAKTKTGLFINKLGIPESLKFVKKYKTWRTTSKATTGELKKQKYEQQTLDKNKEIENYASRIMELNAIDKGKLTPEQKKELKTVESKLKSAESDLDYISIKNAEWQTKSAKSQSNLQKLQATRILPSTKKDIDRNIQLQQKAFQTQMKNKTIEKQTEINDKVKLLGLNPNVNPEFAKTLNAKTEELNIKLNQELTGKSEDEKKKINAAFEAKKHTLKETLINEEKEKMLKEADNAIELERKKIQLEAYNSQIKKISEKLGINIKPDNPQLKALIAEHHDKPNAIPLTGEELIKKVSEVGFANIVSNKQTIKQATKYLSAPQAVFKPGQEKVAVNNLGNNSAKRSFYTDYVKDAEVNLNVKLTDPATAGANKVKLAKLKGQLDVMNADRRFKGATKDEYLYNLFKSNESLLGITGTTTRVADANKVKQAILTNPATLKAAAEAYYSARTKGMSSEGLKRLAAIYNPALKKYISEKHEYSTGLQSFIIDGLKTYKGHIQDLLRTNPLALKAEDPETYDKIIAAQQSRPSTTQIGPTAAQAAKKLEESEA